MAEEKDENTENPFSYQSFVKSKDTTKKNNIASDNSSSLEDIFQVASSSGARKKPKTQLVVTSDPVPKTKKHNPFSFKQFLSKEPKGTQLPHTRDSRQPMYASDLPDFVPSDNSLDNVYSQDTVLPDFTLGTHIVSNSSAAQHSTVPFDIGNNQVLHSVISDLNVSQKVSIPDFLSDTNITTADGAIFNKGSTNTVDGDLFSDTNVTNIDGAIFNKGNTNTVDSDLFSDTSLQTANGDLFNGGNTQDGRIGIDMFDKGQADGSLEGNIQKSGYSKLHSENMKLNQDMTNLKKILETERERSGNLQKQLNGIKEKENTETQALEDMVLRVEANLKLTTERAVKAENTISKLKQEVKTLQSQISTLSAENKSSQRGDTHNAICAKSQNASYQLRSAAQTAEQQLKQLLGGIGSLKLLADMLEDIDKVTEEPVFEDQGATSGSF